MSARGEECGIALFGCGTVGMGVAQLLLGRKGAVSERMADRLALKYVVDKRTQQVREELAPPDSVAVTDDFDAALADPQVGVVVELFGGVQAAGSVIEQALRHGKDVVTANKALLALEGDSLFRLARQCGRSIAFEGSVAGGIPIISALRDDLVANRIESIYGIVNGTCNYILTQMTERGVSYEEALREAQAQGYAEADPRLDVEGHDSAHKLAVLARLAFGVRVELRDIACEGIAQISVKDLHYARSLGYTLKLLAMGIRTEDGIELRVHPALLPQAHPLASVGGAYNAVCVHGDVAGEVVFTGLGAGRWPTASAVVADIWRVALGTYRVDFAALRQFGEVPPAPLVPFENVRARYYFRLSCLDQPGVLAQVAGVLGQQKMSIASCIQQELPAAGQRHVPVVFMTHRAREGAVRKALERINQLECIDGSETRMLRVQDI